MRQNKFSLSGVKLNDSDSSLQSESGVVVKTHFLKHFPYISACGWFLQDRSGSLHIPESTQIKPFHTEHRFSWGRINVCTPLQSVHEGQRCVWLMKSCFSWCWGQNERKSDQFGLTASNTVWRVTPSAMFQRHMMSKSSLTFRVENFPSWINANMIIPTLEHVDEVIQLHCG